MSYCYPHSYGSWMTLVVLFRWKSKIYPSFCVLPVPCTICKVLSDRLRYHSSIVLGVCDKLHKREKELVQSWTKSLGYHRVFMAPTTTGHFFGPVPTILYNIPYNLGNKLFHRKLSWPDNRLSLMEW